MSERILEYCQIVPFETDEEISTESVKELPAEGCFAPLATPTLSSTNCNSYNIVMGQSKSTIVQSPQSVQSIGITDEQLDKTSESVLNDSADDTDDVLDDDNDSEDDNITSQIESFDDLEECNAVCIKTEDINECLLPESSIADQEYGLTDCQHPSNNSAETVETLSQTMFLSNKDIDKIESTDNTDEENSIDDDDENHDGVAQIGRCFALAPPTLSSTNCNSYNIVMGQSKPTTVQSPQSVQSVGITDEQLDKMSESVLNDSADDTDDVLDDDNDSEDDNIISQIESFDDLEECNAVCLETEYINECLLPESSIADHEYGLTNCQHPSNNSAETVENLSQTLFFGDKDIDIIESTDNTDEESSINDDDENDDGVAQTGKAEFYPDASVGFEQAYVLPSFDMVEYSTPMNVTQIKENSSTKVENTDMSLEDDIQEGLASFVFQEEDTIPLWEKSTVLKQIANDNDLNISESQRVTELDIKPCVPRFVISGQMEEMNSDVQAEEKLNITKTGNDREGQQFQLPVCEQNIPNIWDSHDTNARNVTTPNLFEQHKTYERRGLVSSVSAPPLNESPDVYNFDSWSSKTEEPIGFIKVKEECSSSSRTKNAFPTERFALSTQPSRYDTHEYFRPQGKGISSMDYNTGQKQLQFSAYSKMNEYKSTTMNADASRRPRVVRNTKRHDTTQNTSGWDDSSEKVAPGYSSITASRKYTAWPDNTTPKWFQCKSTSTTKKATVKPTTKSYPEPFLEDLRGFGSRIRDIDEKIDTFPTTIYKEEYPYRQLSVKQSVLHSDRPSLGAFYQDMSKRTIEPQRTPPKPAKRTRAIPPNHIEVRNFKDDTYIMFVSKTLSVKEATSQIKNHLDIAKPTQVDLFWNGALLSKYSKLKDCCGDFKLYVIKHPGHRSVDSIYLTDARDMTDHFETEESRVRMPCNHAITPTNLYRYCWTKVRDGAITVTCPEIPDENRPNVQCGRSWTFSEIVTKTSMSEDEICLFQVTLFNNWCESNEDVYQCPDCGIYIQSSCGSKGYFKCNYPMCSNRKYCVKCYRPVDTTSQRCSNNECMSTREKLQQQLSYCQKKNIIGVTGCPTVRACPLCHTIIHHDGDACKHMDCPNKTCREKFCFICLAIRDDGVYWPDSCGGAFTQCRKAPIQTVS